MTSGDKMISPLVTIGIPTYNRAHYLRESISAALAQSYSKIEVIVSDNASTDNTKDVVLALSDSRIVYSRGEQNVGAENNFARVLQLATGKYFGWLQDDDL